MKEYIVPPKNFFQNTLRKAFKECQIHTCDITPIYLANLLETYIETKNLYDLVDNKGQKKRETLAEIYLKAFSTQISFNQRKNLLKKLGDTSLYISGFFKDSLKRKPIDIDYYINMGRVSYKHLSLHTREKTYSFLFLEFSRRFQEFVEALTYISKKLFLQNEEGILNLHDAYEEHPQLVQKQLIKRNLYQPKSKKTVQ